MQCKGQWKRLNCGTAAWWIPYLRLDSRCWWDASRNHESIDGWSEQVLVQCCSYCGNQKCRFLPTLFFFFSSCSSTEKCTRGKNKWRETKKNCKICCSFNGGWIKVLSRSLVVWSCARGGNNFITRHDPLLISIYPLGNLSRTLNSSGCRWTLFFFLHGCCCHCAQAESKQRRGVLRVYVIDQMKLTQRRRRSASHHEVQVRQHI